MIGHEGYDDLKTFSLLCLAHCDAHNQLVW